MPLKRIQHPKTKTMTQLEILNQQRQEIISYFKYYYGWHPWLDVLKSIEKQIKELKQKQAA